MIFKSDIDKSWEERISKAVKLDNNRLQSPVENVITESDLL